MATLAHAEQLSLRLTGRCYRPLCVKLQAFGVIWQTSICWTVRSRKVFSLRTLIRLLGPLQPMLVPRPPFSFTTTSLFRLSAMLSGRPFALILSNGWIWKKDKKDKQLSVRTCLHCITLWKFKFNVLDYIILEFINDSSSDYNEVSKFHTDAVAIGVCVCVCVHLIGWFLQKKSD